MCTLRIAGQPFHRKDHSVASNIPQEPGQTDSSLQDRRGRRIALSCRLFFFGDDDFEGEATVLDVSTNGCSAESSVELKIGMILKLSLFLADFKWPLSLGSSLAIMHPLLRLLEATGSTSRGQVL